MASPIPVMPMAEGDTWWKKREMIFKLKFISYETQWVFIGYPPGIIGGGFFGTQKGFFSTQNGLKLHIRG
jgi:hypothetical protein